MTISESPAGISGCSEVVFNKVLGKLVPEPSRILSISNM